MAVCEKIKLFYHIYFPKHAAASFSHLKPGYLNRFSVLYHKSEQLTSGVGDQIQKFEPITID